LVWKIFQVQIFFCTSERPTNRAVERGREAVIFTGAQTSKGAQESEIYLFLSHISKFYRGPGKIHRSLYGPGLQTGLIVLAEDLKQM
jgi:hypothetical protein